MPGFVKISVDETCHVAWKVRRGNQTAFLHAIGDGSSGTRVTSDMAEKRFAQGKCFSPWLPVVFVDRAVTYDRKSINCVTAASRAILRGWLYFP